MEVQLLRHISCTAPKPRGGKVLTLGQNKSTSIPKDKAYLRCDAKPCDVREFEAH